MRDRAKLKMGYYPLPESEGVKLRSLLSFIDPASVVDPCVGQGIALQIVTGEAPVRRYGIELDAECARIASSKGIETIQGNAFDAIAKPDSFRAPARLLRHSEFPFRQAERVSHDRSRFGSVPADCGVRRSSRYQRRG